MTKEKNPLLSEHFEKLKTLLPEVYARHFREERETRNQKLFQMLKNALGVIEAVYLQNTEGFTLAKVEEYSKIIEELEQLGYTYNGHPELLDKVANYMIMNKKPMEKAKGGIQKGKEDRKAI